MVDQEGKPLKVLKWEERFKYDPRGATTEAQKQALETLQMAREGARRAEADVKGLERDIKALEKRITEETVDEVRTHLEQQKAELEKSLGVKKARLEEQTLRVTGMVAEAKVQGAESGAPDNKLKPNQALHGSLNPDLSAALSKRIGDGIRVNVFNPLVKGDPYVVEFPNNLTGQTNNRALITILHDVLGAQQQIQRVQGKFTTFIVPEAVMQPLFSTFTRGRREVTEETRALEVYLASKGLEAKVREYEGKVEIYPKGETTGGEIADLLGEDGAQTRTETVIYTNETTGERVTVTTEGAGEVLAAEEARQEVARIAEEARRAEAARVAEAEARPAGTTGSPEPTRFTRVAIKADGAFGRATNHGQAVVSFTKMLEAATAGNFEAAYNNMVNGVTSEMFATLKYWAPPLARLIGKEGLERVVRQALPFTGAAFGVKDICEACLSEDPALKKRCAMTIISNVIEVLPLFVPGVGTMLKFMAVPDLISIAANKLVGLLNEDYRALDRPVEAIITGAREAMNGEYTPTAPTPARRGY